MMDEHTFEGIIECLLFACADPVEGLKIAQRLDIDIKRLDMIIGSMNEKYKRANRGIAIRRIGDSYQLHTKGEYHEFLDIFAQRERKPSLSQAAYETLAIIGVNGPVTRAQVERIRGVNSDGIIVRLTEYGFIEERGRLDVPGNPFLYDVTPLFYRDFGLSGRDDMVEIFENIKGE